MAKLNNENTHFGKFVWRDSKKLREALQSARDQFWPSAPPVKTKVKL